MARAILWIYVIMFLLISIMNTFSEKDLFQDSTWNVNWFWTIIGILAICESIERIKTGGNNNVKS